jgi:hypothetical protein
MISHLLYEMLESGKLARQMVFHAEAPFLGLGFESILSWELVGGEGTAAIDPLPPFRDGAKQVAGMQPTSGYF